MAVSEGCRVKERPPVHSLLCALVIVFSLSLSLSSTSLFFSVSLFSYSFTIFVMAREHAYLRTLATGISEEFRTRNFYPSVLTVSRTRHVSTAAPRFVSIARVPRSNGEKALTVVVQRKTALPRSQHVEWERKRVFRSSVFAAARICVPRWTRFSCRREFFFYPPPPLTLSLSLFCSFSGSLSLSIFGINCLEKRGPCTPAKPRRTVPMIFPLPNSIPTCPTGHSWIKYRQLHRGRAREIADTENIVSSRVGRWCALVEQRGPELRRSNVSIKRCYLFGQNAPRQCIHERDVVWNF